ncbi:MAG: hypothetical protein HOP33_11690 [Verrucomicrobia bacterium]|nr:hypothetical protein [Verrucomicrobiota bacterium]
MKKLAQPILCAALFSLAALSTFAQGTAFTYQGRLEESSGPANGSYDFNFQIFDAASGGASQGGPLTNSAVSVNGSLFTVTLDFGNQFSGADRWIEIAVRTNGVGAFGLLSPRQKLTPTPYAIYSGSVNASGISGTLPPSSIANGTITTLMLASGAVGSNQLAAGAVTTVALADGAVTGAKIFSSFNLLSTLAVTNPTPLASDQFGFAVAAVGTDKIFVGANLDDAGANNAGAAHLFDTAGNLLVTLTNPTPAADDNFGYAVGAVGTDKLLVGAYLDDTGALNAGSAYLFNISGALLLTLTNPSPSVADGFGFSVTAVGSENFLIGSFHDNPGGGQFGAAYLYDLSGNLVQSFTNPTPANLDGFGTIVAVVGADKVLIGAPGDDTGASGAGAAYLFNINGTLLTTFTNPTPVASDAFGSAVVAVDADKLLISAPADDTGATDAGAAYLYDLSGNLLKTFTNPAPASTDQFGKTLTAVGASQVLIGAPTDDAGAANAGTAYLLDLSGKLLLTITNPTPATQDQFAAALAAFDANHIIVGTLQADLSVANAGGVYLLSFDTFTPGLVADAVRFGGVDSASIANGAITTASLADGAITVDKMATVPAFASQLVITNPTPETNDRFGYWVTAVGSDRFMVGAPGDSTVYPSAGAAYLFATGGTLLGTITNPSPSTLGGPSEFGRSIAALGSDRVVIGSYWDDTGAVNTGAAYLFNTSGTLLQTITNPVPAFADRFGHSVAALGTDRILVSAESVDTGAVDAGVAYLLTTNGTVLTTFTNPTPVIGDYFGFGLAAVGTDRVLISAHKHDTGASDTGASYLFNTNGTLLVTLTNPAPSVGLNFGYAVAAMGSDRLLIGAPVYGSIPGAAYLFSTNGALLHTFTNPSSVGDNFGSSVTALGVNRVLIGADHYPSGGIAYLFDTNGTLLNTFSGTASSEFGYSVAALGDNRVLIGATGEDLGAGNAGAVYLFSEEAVAPGLFASGVAAGTIKSLQIAPGAITADRLDPSIGLWTAAGDDVYRSLGNVGIGTSFPTNKLHVRGGATFASGSGGANQAVVWTPGNASWSFTSDRNAKDRIKPVDAPSVLEKVSRVPIAEWSYIGYPQRHIGPMAQDFHDQFPLNGDDRSLNDADLHGVALAAIQGLNQKLEQKEAEITELKHRLEKLERLFNEKHGGVK